MGTQLLRFHRLRSLRVSVLYAAPQRFVTRSFPPGKAAASSTYNANVAGYDWIYPQMHTNYIIRQPQGLSTAIFYIEVKKFSYSGKDEHYAAFCSFSMLSRSESTAPRKNFSHPLVNACSADACSSSGSSFHVKSCPSSHAEICPFRKRLMFPS